MAPQALRQIASQSHGPGAHATVKTNLPLALARKIRSEWVDLSAVPQGELSGPFQIFAERTTIETLHIRNCALGWQVGLPGGCGTAFADHSRTILQKEQALLTEQQVSRSWSKIFDNHEYTDENFERAEELLEELRPESPLRHRLLNELEELRKIHSKLVK